MLLNILISKIILSTRKMYRKLKESAHKARSGTKKIKNILGLIAFFKTNHTKIYKLK
jgi:hypothetical protein